MDWEKYLLLLVVLCLEEGETGGHGEKHHDHVKVYVPEFIHHDHHTKVVTIHHHHHKPKKEHHHHHHHHPKPHIPLGHHYHHHQKKAHTTTHTTASKGHHKHHGHHGHHGHKSHGHHGHGHHHHDPVPVSYDPPAIPSFDENYGSFSPSVPAYGGIGSHVSQVPQVHGITHTVKQVQVFDSLPGVIPGAGGHGGSHGYEVTEQGDEGEDDVFTSVNNLQNSFPATYGYLRGAGEQTPNDPFAELTPQSVAQAHHHDPFAGAIAQPSVSLGGGQSFTGIAQNDPFASSAPSANAGPLSAQPSPEFPVSFQGASGFDDPSNAFVGDDGGNTAFLTNSEGTAENDSPVSFHREAGIQQSVKTGGVETIVY